MGDGAERVPILQNKCCQFWETHHNALHINVNRHSVLPLVLSMQISKNKACWHHCYILDVNMRNEVLHKASEMVCF